MPALASFSLPGSPGSDITSQALELVLEDANHLWLEPDRLVLGLAVLEESVVALLLRSDGRVLNLDGDEHHRHQNEDHPRNEADQLHVEDDVVATLVDVVHDGSFRRGITHFLGRV